MELRLRGANNRQIAKELGISDGRATQLYNRALNRVLKPVTELVRIEQLERIDRVELSLFPKLNNPNPDIGVRAAAVLARLEHLRMKLCGTEMPVKIDMKADMTVGQDEAERAEQLALARAMNPEEREQMRALLDRAHKRIQRPEIETTAEQVNGEWKEEA